MDDETMNNTAIHTTTLEEIEDPEKVVNINTDKLANVDDETIVKACNKLVDIDQARSDLNEQASDIRAELRTLGVPTASFNAAYARFKKSEAKRAEQDAGYAKCCRAMGVAYQPGLFG